MPKLLSVIVVEDENAVRSAMASAVMRAPGLRLAGAADDVADALALLEREQPDVALVDLGLPSGSGLEIVRAGSLIANCSVIVVSALGDERLVLSAIAAGAVGYMLKDAQPEDLIAQIAVLRSGGSPVSPLIARLLLSHLGQAASRSEPALEVGGQPSSGKPPSLDISLSVKEQQVLRLCALGYTFEEISEQMSLSRHTVETYVRRSYRKLQVHSKTEAVVQARQRGLL
jgi:DNA-binding NarL/FixJ family response regulator